MIGTHSRKTIKYELWSILVSEYIRRVNTLYTGRDGQKNYACIYPNRDQICIMGKGLSLIYYEYENRLFPFFYFGYSIICQRNMTKKTDCVVFPLERQYETRVYRSY